MNVTCNKCSKKYVIADDKVAGKASVKIRCKQCQNLITVSVGGVSMAAAPAGQVSAVAPVSAPPPAPQAWEEARTRAMPQLDLTATWYAMIAGKQQGPFDVAALQTKVALQEVTLRTYLWKPGMSDWKRASDVPEVSPIFAGVSVGATATGPTQASAEVQRPHSKNTAAVQRDVAISNELPLSDELVPRKKTSTVVYGSDDSKAAASAARAAFEEAPKPAPGPAATNPAGNNGHSGHLNDLFADVGAPSATHKVSELVGAAEPSHSGATETSTSGQLDPFAQLAGPVKEGEAPAIGEATKFFIARAGVNKRNPPWKIALFLLGGIGIPVLIGWVLTTFGVVQLTVTRVDEHGQEVQEPFFSPSGLGDLKDVLTGDAKRKKEEADRLRAQREQLAIAAKAAADRKNNAAIEPAEVPDKPTVTKPVDPTLAKLYEEDDRIKKPIKFKKMGDEADSPSVNAAGLSQQAAMKVVAEKSKAFQTCVERALHRNPNLAVGNIVIVLNVGKSGAVTSADVAPEKHRESDWAKCMVLEGKRIVFPSSDGETILEVPFKVGVAITP